MAMELVIGGAVGAGVLYVWVWRRFAAIQAYRRRHQRNDDFERRLRAARAELSGPNPWREATASDAELLTRFEPARADERALEACGFTRLGDLVADVTPLRAYVDREATTCAFLTAHSDGVVRLSLRSFAAGGETFTTRRGRLGDLAEPPFVHVTTLADDVAMTTVVARQRELRSSATLVTIQTLGELVAAIGESRAKRVSWRESLPPDELLDADLRASLGDHYGAVGKIWARRLRGRLPVATARRV
jgi:hypothetical protein